MFLIECYWMDEVNHVTIFEQIFQWGFLFWFGLSEKSLFKKNYEKMANQKLRWLGFFKLIIKIQLLM